MGIIAMIIIGAAAGFFATRLLRIEADSLTTVAVGVGGVVVGGLLLRFLLMITGWMAGFVGAVLGAMLLILLWQTYITR
jgi:uncharacterized membrane protein YeaQ/YmgE (transglycosylase-associated protein family)